MAGWQDAPIVGGGDVPETPGAGWQSAPIVTDAPAQAQREGLFPQFASGMTEGGAALLNTPANMLTPIEMGLRSIGPAIGNAVGGDFPYPTADQSWLPRPGDSLVNFGENVGAMTPVADDGIGRITRRVGQEVGANAVPALGVMSKAQTVAQALARGGTELVLSLFSGGGAGVANEIQPDNPFADLAGQILGYGLGRTALNAGARAITPAPMTPEQIATRDYLKSQGVDLTAGQASGNNGLRYAESELGGAAAENFTAAQQQQFTKAALNRVGIDAPTATPDVMRKAYQDLGDEFDTLASKSTLPVDNQLNMDLQANLTDYTGSVGAANQAPIVERYIDEVYDLAANSPAGQPSLTGEQYKSLRSRLGETIRKTSNLEVKSALQDVQASLDDGVERFLAATKPDELGAWRDVRRRYRDFLIIERAASGAGEAAAQGIISPAQLSAAVKSFDGRRGFVQGRGDFSELARSGVAAMSPLPNSGTAARMGARAFMTGTPTIAGALLGSSAGGGDLIAGMMGGAAGAAIPNAVGRGMVSPAGRALLSNQLFQKAPVGAANTGNLVARALAASGGYDN